MRLLLLAIGGQTGVQDRAPEQKLMLFQSTTGFAASLQMPVSDSIAKNMRAAADYVAARAGALPQHLQLGVHP